MTTFAERKAQRIASGPKQNTFFVRAASRYGGGYINLPTIYASKREADQAIWNGNVGVELWSFDNSLQAGAWIFEAFVKQ